MSKLWSQWSSLSKSSIDYITARMKTPGVQDTPLNPTRDLVVVTLVLISIVGLLVVGCIAPIWFLAVTPRAAHWLDAWGLGFFWLLGGALWIRGTGTQPFTRIILGLVLCAAPLLLLVYRNHESRYVFDAGMCLFWGTAFWFQYDGIRDSHGAGSSTLRASFSATMSGIAYGFGALFFLPPAGVDLVPALSSLLNARPASFFFIISILLTPYKPTRTSSSKSSHR